MADQREQELREALIDAHDALLRRDAEVEELTAHATALQRERDEARAALAHERAALERERAALAQANAALDARGAEALALRTRLDRIVQSPPWRLYARLQRLPLLRAIRRRRELGYRAELERRSARP